MQCVTKNDQTILPKKLFEYDSLCLAYPYFLLIVYTVGIKNTKDIYV